MASLGDDCILMDLSGRNWDINRRKHLVNFYRNQDSSKSKYLMERDCIHLGHKPRSSEEHGLEAKFQI